MHQLFGELKEQKCKDCQHMVSYTASRKWYKCECYSLSCSESSDWRLKWTACGLFNKEYYGNPVVNMVTKKKVKSQIEGQMMLFD